MTPQPGSTAAVRRTDNLPLIFQEVLTAIVRLRSDRQAIADAESFRQHIREALKTASQEALNVAGYTGEDIRMAAFALVGFLDESILNLQNPNLRDWARKPLQEELFGTHMAGEVFFEHVQAMLERKDAPDLADLLEVHYLCLLLGYRGRYSVQRADLQNVMAAIAEKIRRIRGQAPMLSRAWELPPEKVAAARDPWVRRLGIAAAVSFGLLLVLFLVYWLLLHSGVSDFRTLATQGKV